MIRRRDPLWLYVYPCTRCLGLRNIEYWEYSAPICGPCGDALLDMQKMDKLVNDDE